MENNNVIIGDDVDVEQLRKQLAAQQRGMDDLLTELERVRETLTAEQAARVTIEERHAIFRRTVVETALTQAEDRSWCDEVYDILDDLGLDESDGVPPAEREETVTVNIRDLSLEVTVLRGQQLDTELVEEAFTDWVREHFGNRHWS